MDTVLKQIVSSFNPFAVMSDNYKVDLLPRLVKDDLTNKALINAIVAGGGMLTLASIAKAVSHKINAKKWEKKSKRIVEDKLNALYPIAAPNYDKDAKTTDEIRKIGLNEIAKQANGEESTADKIKKYFELSLKGSLPIVATMTAAAVAPSLIQERLENKDEDELDVKIREKRNELDALRAKLIDLQLNKKANNEDGSSDGNPFATTTAYGLAALLAALVPGAYMVANSYLKKNDRARKIVEAGADASSRNLTNIPQRLSLKLTAEGRPALNKQEQQYVQELKELADTAAIANVQKEIKQLEAPRSTVDFDDKITKVEKDALFS